MSLHHATLKAAVKTYGALLTEGKSEAEVRAAIAADEKLFTPEQVDEIYAAIVAPPEPKLEATGYVVKTQFRDKDNFNKVYEVGDDISHFDEARKADLVGRGLIEAKDQE